jgi:DNA-binding transcriptional LysR family regulator
LRQAGQEIEAIKSGHFGEVRVGAITSPALNLLPNAVAIIAREHPNLRVQIQVESSDVLIENLLQGKLDIMVGRLFERHDKTNVLYEKLAVEPVCAVVRPGHALLGLSGLKLSQLEKEPWIVPPMGSVLRHRFDLMFHESGLSAPTQLIETSVLLFITKMLQQSDFIAVVPTDVGRYYASYGMVAMLPIQLSCSMDAFGIITRKDWLLSPAANVVLKALKTAAISSYDSSLEA